MTTAPLNHSVPRMRALCLRQTGSHPRGSAWRPLAILIASLGFGVAAPSAGASAEHSLLHPQDGPDADLRMRIGERAVTWQITLNLAFLDEIVPITREDLYSLHELEYPAVQESLVRHVLESDSVHIDGVEVTPKVKSFAVEDADLSLLPLFPNMGTRAMIKVALVLEYPVLQSPTEVSFHWSSYPTDTVMAALLGGSPPLEITGWIEVGGDAIEVLFTEDRPDVKWRGTVPTLDERMLTVPEPQRAAPPTIPGLSLGLGLLGALALMLAARKQSVRPVASLSGIGLLVAAALTTETGRVPLPPSFAGDHELPDEAQALAIFGPLHANIYRAFDYDDPGEIYDALSRSVRGDLLDELYDDVYQGLVLQEEGGAVCRVQAVDPIETLVESIGPLDDGGPPGFVVDTRWRVAGVVHHFGHSHGRVNEYRARYAVALDDDAWRIHSHETLEQFRVSATPLGETGTTPVRNPDEI